VRGSGLGGAEEEILQTEQRRELVFGVPWWTPGETEIGGAMVYAGEMLVIVIYA
jgi:hypothetical protein